MSRNLVICCDGTSNTFGYDNTNVVRLVEVLDSHPDRQIVYYDPGVGTLPEPSVFTAVGKKISEWSALAFGLGINRKVEQAYQFLMDVWEPGDQVFLFGFSRGAYTVRVLAGMLHALGLLPKGNHNLVPYAVRLLRAIDEKHETRAGSNKAHKKPNFWQLTNNFRRIFARQLGDDDNASRRFPVHFLGLWDTVTSVGWVWEPVRFPYAAKNPSIAIIRHAVALDERRWFFRQNLINPAEHQDARERWFSGVHADVGGGYPEQDDGLWRIPLRWIVDEAVKFGLSVNNSLWKSERFLSTSLAANWPTQTPHESLDLRWWPAEFFPKLAARQVKARDDKPPRWHRVPALGLGRGRRVRPGALLDGSVLERIRTKSYEPRNLSPRFLQEVHDLAIVPDEMPYHP